MGGLFADRAVPTAICWSADNRLQLRICSKAGSPAQLMGGILHLHSTRVEAGKNTSTVIPASRKRRREGNPVVSDLYILYLCVPYGSHSKQH
jgi:hypothetical protein